LGQSGGLTARLAGEVKQLQRRWRGRLRAINNDIDRVGGARKPFASRIPFGLGGVADDVLRTRRKDGGRPWEGDRQRSGALIKDLVNGSTVKKGGDGNPRAAPISLSVDGNAEDERPGLAGGDIRQRP
jgi:hypothetical protein